MEGLSMKRAGIRSSAVGRFLAQLYRMARPLRLHVPNVPVHVISRGNDRACIFTDTADYDMYLRLLADSLTRYGVGCHGYCAMWNHVHLDLRPHAVPLSRMMQTLNSDYCRWFNKRHGHVGHVLEGRPKMRIIQDGSYHMNVQRYIVLNPVAAGKVRRPEDWPWSSHRAAVGLESVPPFLNLDGAASAFDSGSWEEARERYEAFVNAPGILDEIYGPLFDGSALMAERLDPLLVPLRGNSDFSYAERYATRPALAQLLDGRGVGADLKEGVRRAFFVHAYPLREIAEVLKKHPTTIWRWARSARPALEDTKAALDTPEPGPDDGAAKIRI
jgi:REP element-mobilizing transposase RayT